MTLTNQYDYELPRELIAQSPLERRADARLLVVDRQRQALSECHVRDLPELISGPDCLVLNDTRVIPARLVGRRDRTGGRWQGLFLESDETGLWRVMSKTRGKLTAGETITLLTADLSPGFSLQMVAPQAGGQWIAAPQVEGEPFELLEQVGRVPLPPYIRGGEMVEEDRQRYQTVFAARPGAIAAPTAGLHFTPQLIQQLVNQGVTTCQLTLHVGAGTFRPIESEHIEQHELHWEWGEIDAAAVQQLARCRQRGGRIVAVGTTAVRVLETAAADGTLKPWRGRTNLYIRPPHEFHSVDALLTNFHLPKSTLLVLARTFGGDALVQKAYEYAIQQRFRFFSYGDAMLIV